MLEVEAEHPESAAMTTAPAAMSMEIVFMIL